MKQLGITLPQIVQAIQKNNRDIGAGTVEINRAEYFIRGLGKIKHIQDLETALVRDVDGQHILIGDVARVNMGPAERRGALDKSGAEVVGGVVSAQYSAKPMEVLQNLRQAITNLQYSMPSKVLDDGRKSTLHIVPFYDRTELVNRSIYTLRETLTLEILITLLVIVVMLLQIRPALIVSALLPLSILCCFLFMYAFGIEANILSLAGIAIAIGSVVDIGIVITENVLRQKQEGESLSKAQLIKGFREVYPAVFTAITTTIVSFLPVFALQAEEGRLFQPLALTKTFIMLAALVLALLVLPAFIHLAYRKNSLTSKTWQLALPIGLVLIAIALWISGMEGALLIVLLGGIGLASNYLQPPYKNRLLHGGFVLVVLLLLARWWQPFGLESGLMINALLMLLFGSLFFAFYYAIIRYYSHILRQLIQYRWLFLTMAVLFIGFAGWIWYHSDREFMPPLDEGEFLLMPTSMPHSGVEENLELLKLLDMAVTAVPEVEFVVGKMGRADSALDPAPISMFENIIRYKSEYRTDEQGKKLRYNVLADGSFAQTANGALIPDPNGNYFRQWRPHIRSTADIWQEIVTATRLPGLTAAPRLHPIETRLVMLQTGMKSSLGVKVKGTNIRAIEAFAIQLEKVLKEVQGIRPETVIADRIVGKPYIQLELNRVKAADYGLMMEDILQQLELAIGGKTLTQYSIGRERYDVTLRYPRKWRDDPAAFSDFPILTTDGTVIPLSEVVTVRFEKGPQHIKSEDGFLVAYVTFDRTTDSDALQLVQRAEQHIQEQLNSDAIQREAGVTYHFAGTFEQQQRAAQRMRLVIGLAMLCIFLILYWQFRSVLMSLFIFSGVLLAFAGGFILLWLYGQDWFLNFAWLGDSNLREVLSVGPIALSVAVWIGFLVLLGIATDDGVLIANFIQQYQKGREVSNKTELYALVEKAGMRRVRPAMMTTATTILALLPILSSKGTGSDLMIPMAVPILGGMLFQIMSIFMLPILYIIWHNRKLS